mgnify:CR=1 FL=1
MLEDLKQWIIKKIKSVSEKRPNDDLQIIPFLLLVVVLGPVWMLIWIWQNPLRSLINLIQKAKVKRFFSLIFLFLFPLFFYVAWYQIEDETIKDFIPYGIPSQIYENDAQFKKYLALLDSQYEATKDQYIAFSIPKKESELDAFKSAASTKALGVLGILASLPTHRVCLRNRNAFSYGEITLPDLSDTIASIGVKLRSGGEFYAKVGKDDCLLMSKTFFLNNPRQPVYGYQGRARTYSNGRVEVISFSIDPRESTFHISLALWTIIPFYIFVLPAWSLLFFQYRKIYGYVSGQTKG